MTYLPNRPPSGAILKLHKLLVAYEAVEVEMKRLRSVLTIAALLVLVLSFIMPAAAAAEEPAAEPPAEWKQYSLGLVPSEGDLPRVDVSQMTRSLQSIPSR
jgi:hypothetical protein